MTVEEKIRQLIVEELDWQGSPEELTDDMPLIERDIVDSAGVFFIISFIEEEFDIEVGYEDLVADNFASIAEISRLVASKRLEAE